MAPKKITASHFSRDTQLFLAILYRYQVKYLIVGGEAVIFYGHVRLTGDLDIYYDSGKENVKKLYRALDEFWEGNIPYISTAQELSTPELIVQYGMPPNRIDLLNNLDHLNFGEAWSARTEIEIKVNDEPVIITYIGLQSLIKNKEAVHRPRDIEDLAFLVAVYERQNGKG
jgi:hypothetical protein